MLMIDPAPLGLRVYGRAEDVWHAMISSHQPFQLRHIPEHHVLGQLKVFPAAGDLQVFGLAAVLFDGAAKRTQQPGVGHGRRVFQR